MIQYVKFCQQIFESFDLNQSFKYVEYYDYFIFISFFQFFRIK